MKTVQAIYRASYTDYDGLDTYRVMPTRNIPIEALEPFIFLNHHGRQVYGANNKGLPFGPHPHKGFETVTFIIEGELVHQDSTGYKSNIIGGGIQWMTAGKGIIHAETSSDAFKQAGGTVEILQLWVNLPAALKNTAPAYIGLQKPQLPELMLDDGRVIVHPVSGTWFGQQAPIQSLSDVHLATIHLKEGGRLELDIPANQSVLFYVINGQLTVNGEVVVIHELVEFVREEEKIEIKANQETLLLIGHAQPNKEPIVAHGPFVMNTQEEIREAFVQYQQGELGVWQH